MRSLTQRHPLLRYHRPGLARALALAVPLALGACADAGTPLEPAETPAEPSGQTLVLPDSAAAPRALYVGGQRILFTSTRAGGTDLFGMSPAGSSVARLTYFGYYGSEPAWSWDNMKVALIRPRKDANNVEHADIFLMNADGTSKHWARSLPSGFDMRYPSWSPDGVHLVLAVMIGGKPYLATMNVTNGNMAFVTVGGKVLAGNFPSYDKTGKKILYVNGTGKLISELNVATGFTNTLVLSAYVMGVPRYSPDGTRIAFAQVVGPNVDVYVKTLPAGAPQRLTTDPGYDGVPTWSPDGTRIAFQSSRSGHSQIYVMSASTGGGVTRITNTTSEEMNPAWSH